MPFADLSLTPRYSICTLLQSHQIPFTLFLEDALHYYGVPTIVSDLFLLCPQPELLPEILSTAGWKASPVPGRIADRGFSGNLITACYEKSHNIEDRAGDRKEDGNEKAERKGAVEGDENENATPSLIILNPVTWSYPQPSQYEPIPSLPSLLDSLISTWLNASEDQYWGVWTNYLSCLIGYIYRYIPEVKEEGFVEGLSVENRQYHWDELAGMGMRSIRAWKWQREVREGIRRGDWEMKECSVERGDKRFFQAEVERGLLDLMPKVKGVEEYEGEE
ncbi:hypothetical protein BZA77DRAFT_309505 [Pyronema omphalodes]|nr:hypothetical protein BZA77DRAFT_309505 [Pyronema omphalodes]